MRLIELLFEILEICLMNQRSVCAKPPKLEEFVRHCLLVCYYHGGWRMNFQLYEALFDERLASGDNRSVASAAIACGSFS